MGPRFFKRGEARRARTACGSELLQWGHAFSSVESRRKARKRRIGAASMGPRFFKRGESLMSFMSRCGTVASMGPRFFKRGELLPFSIFSPRSTRFNGATLFQAWRGYRWVAHWREHYGFNGATLFQAWRAAIGHEAANTSDSFNGATLFQAWRADKRGKKLRLIFKLQWGHAFSSVERFFPARRFVTRIEASMGPRFFKRGERTSGNHAPGQGRGFNGATLFQAWRDEQTLPAPILIESFNGATLFQAWRDPLQENFYIWIELLQWGHAFSSVERKQAFDEPNARTWLQWGHAFSSVESTYTPNIRRATSSLQWGHAFSSVERLCRRLSHIAR